MRYRLRGDRLRGVLEAKRLKRQHLVKLGEPEDYPDSTVDEWLYRKDERRSDMSAEAAVRIAVLVEVPVEYLLGAPSRYDDFADDFRRIAIEGSLNSFLEQTEEGRQLSPDVIPQLKREIESDDPPTTAARWKARAQTILGAAQWGQVRNAHLNRMLSSGEKRRPARRKGRRTKPGRSS